MQVSILAYKNSYDVQFSTQKHLKIEVLDYCQNEWGTRDTK